MIKCGKKPGGKGKPGDDEAGRGEGCGGEHGASFLWRGWDRKIRRKKGPPWLRGRAESAIISQKRSRVFGTNCFLARKQCCQISRRA